MSDLFQFLHQENVQPELLDAVREYRAMHAVQETLRPRIPVPRFPYYGKSIWEQAIAAVLCSFARVRFILVRSTADLVYWTKSTWQKMKP